MNDVKNTINKNWCNSFIAGLKFFSFCQDKILSQASFLNAKAGLTKTQISLLAAICYFLLFIGGGFFCLASSVIQFNLKSISVNEPFSISPALVVFIFLITCLIKGFLKGFITAILTFFCIFSLILILILFNKNNNSLYYYYLTENIKALGLVGLMIAGTTICIVLIQCVTNNKLITLLSSLTISIVSTAITRYFFNKNITLIDEITFFLGLLFTSSADYMAYKALDIRDTNNHFVWIRSTAFAIISWFGTSFRGIDLTDADFTGAILRNTDFTNANLTRTCFYQARGLDYAKVDGTILVNPVVIDLLTSKKGRRKSFQKLNLRGANLAEADLRGADFSGADLQDATLEKAFLEHAILVGANLKGANLVGVDLSYANLKEADISSANLKSANLEWVNLTNALAVGTDLTQAKLNGVCLGEVWNIDSTTVLDDIECDFFYRLEEPLPGTDDRDRQPASGKFQSGDFIKLHKKITDTVQILLHNGVNNWQAVANALKKIIDENIGIDASSIQSIERRDNDLLVNLQVPPGTEKAEIHEYLMEAYQVRLEAAKNAALLEAEIRHTRDIKDIAIAAIMKHEASQAIVSINNNSNSESNTINETTVDTKAISEATSESKAMNDSTDASRKVELNNVQGNLVGGFGGEFNATGAVLNIGEISGTVTSAINQLPDEPKSDKPGIKDLLTDLQKAIEADTNLNPDDKAEALEKVKVLAAAAQKPQAAETQKEAKGALRFLKGLTTELPSVTDFVKACSQLLPAIATLLGLVA